MFEALASAMLEIHSGAMASAILSDTIPCRRLKVSDEGEGSNDPEPGEQGSSAPAASVSPEAQPLSLRNGFNAAGARTTTARYQPA